MGLIFFLAIVTVLSQKCALSTDLNCTTGNINENSVSLVTLTTKDEQNQWVTTFTAQRDSTYSKDGLIVDLKHIVVECEEKQTIKVHGVVKVHSPTVGMTLNTAPNTRPALVTSIPPIRNCKDGLLFHQRRGPYAEITNNGKTAYRKTGTTDNAGVLTNRMLKKNELFEIVLEELTTGGNSFGFGLSSVPASQYSFANWMTTGWILYDSSLYFNGSRIKDINYPGNLAGIKVGDRVGVQRKDNGDVHFYINGVDEGVAVRGVPEPVYGAFDMWSKGARASIIDNCN